MKHFFQFLFLAAVIAFAVTGIVMIAPYLKQQPQELVCEVDGQIIYRSGQFSSVHKFVHSDVWEFTTDDGAYRYYTPQQGTTCYVHQ